MKKKVLLIGELSEIVRSLNECLVDDFQVQLCSEQIENVEALIKIIKPDLIILCQIGLEDIDKAIFEYIQKKCPKTPAIGITTNELWKQCREYYKSKQFDVLFRPVAKEELLEKCHRILGSYNGMDMESGKADTDNPEKKDMSPADTTSNKKRARKKVMIVDDSALLLRSMKSMLEKHYDICLAKSGEQALKMIPEENPDLILLDYEMEGMDGKDTFEAMKEDKDMQSIPVVFLTSVANRQSIYSVLKIMPDGYILKPPDKDRILETIEEIFGME